MTPGGNETSGHLNLKSNLSRKDSSVSHHFLLPVCGTLPAKNSCFSGWRLITSEPFLHWVWTTHIYQEHLLWWIDLLIPASPHPILLQSMETQWMYLVLVNMPWLSSFTMGRQRKHIMYFIVVFWHILHKVEISTYQGCNFQSLFTKSYTLLHLFSTKNIFSFVLCLFAKKTQEF